MKRLIAQLYRLLGARARAQVFAAGALLLFERLVLAAGAIGVAQRSTVVWLATALVIALWIVRGLLRQNVSVDVRRRLTMKIAASALARGDGSFMRGAEADAAVFEGRHAAEQILVRHFPSLVAEGIAILILLPAMRLSGVPLLASVVTVAAAGLVLAWLREPTARRQREAWRQYMYVAERVLTNIRGATDIVASGHERTILEQLRAKVDEWTRVAARAERSTAVLQRIPLVALAALSIAFLVEVEPPKLANALRLGVLIPPVVGLTRAMLELLRTAPQLLTLGACFDERPVIAPDLARQDMPPPESEIEFERVSFSYNDAPVLRGVSFVWRPGEILGIRGSNGSGKSTLLKLLLGLVEPNNGRILLDGVDLPSLDLGAWRRCVAYLPQRPYLPEKLTVYEAMRLTLPSLTPTDARKALARIRVWDHLTALSEGNGDPLEVPMSSLSVGTRQRVLVARAFAWPASVIVLDEPDENLDHETRATLHDLVMNHRADQMVAIATHDDMLLSTAKTIVNLDAPAGGSSP